MNSKQELAGKGLRFRKRPVVVEARRLTPTNGDRLAQWIYEGGGVAGFNKAHRRLYMQTLESHNTMLAAHIGDWIIRGVRGEFYPCKPDIFAETYESAD